MNIFRPEHPNPIWKRNEWINLNGQWDFEFDFSVSGRERKWNEEKEFSHKINVPFCPESKLSGIENTDFLNCVWYRRSFEIPKEYKDRRCIVHFGAVDYKAYIYVNSELAMTHEGGYTSFECDITKYIKDGENILTVCAEDDVRSGRQPVGKQSYQYYSIGCHYTRVTGIWQTVWLEFVPQTYIKSAKYYPDVENCKLSVEAQVCGKGELTAKAFYEGKQVGAKTVKSNGGAVNFEIELSEKHLWEVGCGRLYDLELTYAEDKVSSYFGLRSLRLDGMKFLINEKSVFQRLVLDQGFYPDGIYTAPAAQDLENDVKLSLDAGFNGARLHEKVFEPLFLYYCDKYGYIVWGEYGNWGFDHTNPAYLHTFINEWRESMQRDFNHPSIVGWAPFNETWDKHGQQQDNNIIRTVYLNTKAFDSTRPCIDTSGNYHVETDIFDVHDYDQNPETFNARYDGFLEKDLLLDKEGKSKTKDIWSSRQTYGGEAMFVSEYGGIKWLIDKDDRENAWGYGEGPQTEEEFVERYRGLTDALLDNKDMFGFCYTQLYDVEQEQNGLYTYDRRPKFDMEIFKKINSRKAKIED